MIEIVRTHLINYILSFLEPLKVQSVNNAGVRHDTIGLGLSSHTYNYYRSSENAKLPLNAFNLHLLVIFRVNKKPLFLRR